MVLTVQPIEKETARRLVLKYHYSRRVPGIKYCWGLVEGSRIVGCVLYSIPASYTLCKGVCGPEMREYVLELSRLVVITKTKNAASLLVGQSLKLLPPSIVVSYADANMGHVGYIYQATNWIYTGLSRSEPLFINPANGQVVSYTRRKVYGKANRLGLGYYGLKQEYRKGKHRYVTFTGDRWFRKEFKSRLRYPISPYPKGKTCRHETGQEKEQKPEKGPRSN